MSSVVSILNQKIEAKHLLKHPFYVAWTNGTLPLENLRHYAAQYFAHVRAFPAYLSEAHSRCADLNTRQVIAANLAEEEATSPPIRSCGSILRPVWEWRRNRCCTPRLALGWRL